MIKGRQNMYYIDVLVINILRTFVFKFGCMLAGTGPTEHYNCL